MLVPEREGSARVIPTAMLPRPMTSTERDSRRTQRVFAAIWIALAVFLVLRTGPRDRGVISDHLEFGRRLIAGDELYAPYLEAKPLHPVYPPSFGLLTAPYALCGDRAARWLWGLTQVGALIVILRALARALERHRPDLRPSTHGLLLLTVLVASRYVLRDTHGGGGNLINLAFVIAAYVRAERGQSTASAVLLGFSLATKPTMVLLVPVFLLLGHVRAALLACVAFIVFVAAALAIHGHGLAPFERWLEGSLAYGRQVDLFATPQFGFPPFTWMNQSLRCMVERWLGTVPAEFCAQVPGFVDGLGLSPWITVWLARGTSAIVLAVTLTLAWRARLVAKRRDLAFAMALAAGVLLSPISWKAHHVALLPAMFALAATAWSRERGARFALGVYFVTCTALGGDLVGDAIKAWQQSLYFATLGAIGLWLWLCVRAHASDARIVADPPRRVA